MNGEDRYYCPASVLSWSGNSIQNPHFDTIFSPLSKNGKNRQFNSFLIRAPAGLIRLRTKKDDKTMWCQNVVNFDLVRTLRCLLMMLNYPKWNKIYICSWNSFMKCSYLKWCMLLNSAAKKNLDMLWTGIVHFYKWIIMTLHNCVSSIFIYVTELYYNGFLHKIVYTPKKYIQKCTKLIEVLRSVIIF